MSKSTFINEFGEKEPISFQRRSDLSSNAFFSVSEIRFKGPTVDKGIDLTEKELIELYRLLAEVLKIN